MTRRMLFVGYSLSDEDFHQLIHEVRAALDQGPDSFGTALMPEPNRLLHHLWTDVEIVDTVNTRNIAILLDYIGWRSTSDVGYVADDSFGKLRSSEEAELAALVSQLAALYDRVAKDPAATQSWEQVEKFLRLFRPSA